MAQPPQDPETTLTRSLHLDRQHQHDSVFQLPSCSCWAPTAHPSTEHGDVFGTISGALVLSVAREQGLVDFASSLFEAQGVCDEWNVDDGQQRRSRPHEAQEPEPLQKAPYCKQTNLSMQCDFVSVVLGLPSLQHKPCWTLERHMPPAALQARPRVGTTRWCKLSSKLPQSCDPSAETPGLISGTELRAADVLTSALQFSTSPSALHMLRKLALTAQRPWQLITSATMALTQHPPCPENRLFECGGSRRAGRHACVKHNLDGVLHGVVVNRKRRNLGYECWRQQSDVEAP